MGVLVWAGALAVQAQPAGDVSGLYKKDGGTLAIVQGDNETLVHYLASFSQGESEGTCDCAMVVKSRTGTRWTLEGPALAPDTLSLSVQAGRLVLEGPSPRCCGAGWPGRDTFTSTPAPAPLRSCKARAARVYFHATDEANTQRKAYVVQGDAVQALLLPTEPELVPARFKGGKLTAGLLPRAQLDCAPPASPPAVKAEQLRPLAGKWVELTKRKGGYVRFKPCAADTRRFTVQPDTARLDVELGQESLSTRVTKLQPGAGKGGYVLELTSEGGVPERVEWKVVDAGKGLVSLSSPELFTPGATYVRESGQGAFRVEAEKNCAREQDAP
ncbi:MAG: hypothetical protein ABW123_03740 [Cystobacter sp.]